MAGEFNSPVAKQDPNISTQEFGITMDKDPSVDTEKNRYTMLNDFAFDKMPYVGSTLKDMQRELVPTTATSLINVDYSIECILVHDSTFGDGKEVPGIMFPVIVARNPEGAYDQGNEGMVATQMAQQQQFYAAQVMQPGSPIPQVNYGYQEGAPAGGPPMGQPPMMQGQPAMQPPQGAPMQPQMNAYPQL